MRRFVAPGKAVVLGEYAVLLGAPAVVAAVDRGVACEVTPSPTLRITTPSDDRFVRPALEAVGAPPAHYHFVDAAPALAQGKVGLGGSAAATVVACLAGSTLAGRPLTADALRSMAHDVHHRVQGSGSGIDVAAAAHGGVFRWEAGRAVPIEAPPIRLAYSGSSATTGPRVVAFRAWATAHPDAAARFVADTVALVQGFHDDPMGVLDAAGQRLGEMAQEAGIAYWTPGLQALVAQTRLHGGGAKPSGAGGGDVVVAILPHGHVARWQAAVEAEGYPVLPVAIAPGAHELIPEEGAPPAA